MLKLIVNPVAGQGLSLKVAKQIEEALAARGVAYSRVDSQYPLHAIELARAAVAERPEGVVAVGGDGTVFEIVDALCDSGVTLYFAPCGTGNDFVKVLGLPRDPLAAFLLQLDTPPRPLDAAQVNQYRFANVSGTGFDIEVLRQTLRFKKKMRGLLPYICGVACAVGRFRPIAATIRTGDFTLTKKFTIISVANGQYIGGGMRVAPTADPFDGLLDVYYVDAVPRAVIPFLMPLFIGGWYRHLPIAHHLLAREIAIQSPGMTVNIDGELMDMDEARYRILPGSLRVRVPIN